MEDKSAELSIDYLDYVTFILKFVALSPSLNPPQ